MQKPFSIRAMNFISYLMLAIFFVFIVPTIKVVPEGISLARFYTYLAGSFISLIMLIFFIRRRKLFPALIASIVGLFLPLGFIQLVLYIVIILLFFLKSTRDYFRGVNAMEPEPASHSQEQLQSEEVNGEALPEPFPKSLSLSRKDPEVYIREATPEDADTIHTLMHIAFQEYKTAIPPSSALDETSESILEALKDQGESAAILYEDDTATAMVRFKYIDDAIYFFRLSVIPSRRRRGYARQLVQWIEKQGVSKGMNISRCKVRQSVQNNLVLYQNMGYEIVDQELVVRPAGTVKALTMEKKIGLR